MRRRKKIPARYHSRTAQVTLKKSLYSQPASTTNTRAITSRAPPWAGRPAAPVVQALRWLGPNATSDPRTVSILQRHLPDDVKKDLVKGRRYIPTWAGPIVDKVVDQPSVAA